MSFGFTIEEASLKMFGTKKESTNEDEPPLPINPYQRPFSATHRSYSWDALDTVLEKKHEMAKFSSEPTLFEKQSGFGDTSFLSDVKLTYPGPDVLGGKSLFSCSGGNDNFLQETPATSTKPISQIAPYSKDDTLEPISTGAKAPSASEEYASAAKIHSSYTLNPSAGDASVPTAGKKSIGDAKTQCSEEPLPSTTGDTKSHKSRAVTDVPSAGEANAKPNYVIEGPLSLAEDTKTCIHDKNSLSAVKDSDNVEADRNKNPLFLDCHPDPNDIDDYCIVTPFQGGDSPIVFEKGLILYSKNKSYHCDIAEAPFMLRHTEKLKPLVGRFEICINENYSINHVRCHDLKKEKETDLHYFIDEEYEHNEHVVAILLINSSDTLKLDPQLQNKVVVIPVYVTGSESGNEIIHHIKNSSGCQCEFVFSAGNKKDTKPIQKNVNHQNLKPEAKVSPNELQKHLRAHLLVKEKNQLVTRNIASFQLVISAFANEELTQNSEFVLIALRELKDNMHTVYRQEFIFLIVLFSLLTKYKENAKVKKMIKTVYDDFQQRLINLDIKDIAPIVNQFYQAGDFGVKFIGISTNESVFHLLYITINSILNEYCSKFKLLAESNEILFLTVMIRWTHVALMFKNCTVNAALVWEKIISQIQMGKMTHDQIATLTNCFADVSHLILPSEDTLLGSGSLQLMLIKTTLFHLFDDLRDIIMHMKNWMKTPEDFDAILCKAPLSIHKKNFKKLHDQYIDFAVGKNKSRHDIVIEGFLYLDDVVQCFHSAFRSSPAPAFGKTLQEWITFLLQFLDIANKESLSIINEIISNCENILSIEFYPSLWCHFLSQVQSRGEKCLYHLSLDYFTELSQICKGLWPVMVVTKFLENNVQKLGNHSLIQCTSTFSHFSECFKGAYAHRCLVDHLLKPFANIYSNNGRHEHYVLQLVQLNTKHLLTVQNDNSDDNDVVQDFIHFLKSYVVQYRKFINFSKTETFEAINKQLKSVNKFKSIVLDVISEELYSFSFENFTCNHQWMKMLIICVEKLVALMKEKANVDIYPLKFYWQIIGGLSKRNDLNYRILTEISPINNEIHQLDTSYPDILAYLNLIKELKKKFSKCKENFLNKKTTFDEIQTFLHRNDEDKKISEKFGFKNIVVDKKILEEAKQDFINCHGRICQLLIKIHPKQNWVSLHTILASYRVMLPDYLENLIQNSFYFPDERHQNRKVQRLPSRVGPILSVKISVTLEEIGDLHHQLEDFLNPIKPFLSFLEHFHLNECQIFGAFIQRELEKYSESAVLSMQNFAIILESVMEEIINILNGAAIYADILSIDGRFASITDITKEIKFITDFEGFGSISTPDIIENVQNMFVLHEIAEHVDALYHFCFEFELQRCLTDSRVKRLRELVQAKASWQKESILALSKIFQEIQTLMGITPGRDFSFLKLFGPLYTETKELRNFLTENNFHGKGKNRFFQLFDLVTQAHQHDEYNAEVLNPLYAVYYYLVPLNKPDLSFQELIDEVSKLDYKSCSAQLKTVNSNIDLIRMWFSKAEGDTVSNTNDELKSITSNGYFNIRVITGDPNEDRITLLFKLESKETYLSDEQAAHSIIWNNTDIQDFIRRLGFAKVEDASTKVLSFIKLNEMVARLQKSMELLHEMGHPEYQKFAMRIKCSSELSDVEEQVRYTEMNSIDWLDHAATNRYQYKWLSFLSNYSIIGIYKLLKSANRQNKLEIAKKIYKQLRFLDFEPQVTVSEHFENVEFSCHEKSPTETVGLYLNKVFQSKSTLQTYSGSRFQNLAFLHQCQKFTSKHLIQCLYSINEKFPKCYELLRCHSEITINDIQLFFQRIFFFPRHYYFLQVNQLTSRLQEFLIQQYMDLHYKMLKSDIDSRPTLHFIESSVSLLHNAPYINTVVENDEDLQLDLLAISCFKSQTQLVYGLQGNGKSHYIRSQLTANNIVIAVNETFSVGSVIDKLKSLTDEKDCSLFFNFTMLPPGRNVAEDERREFESMMEKIGWFMFDFFVLGYIQDQHTGAAFSIPLSENWKVFIEVPSISNDPQNNLNTFKNLIPTFHFIGVAQLIDSSCKYVVDADVQLVCKYLKAFQIDQKEPGSKEGINKLFIEQCDPVKFSTEKDFDNLDACWLLLNEYMPDYIKERKITQKLFIKYIKRRCEFLDNLPQYNFNQGRSFDGSDTKKLGSTLMNAMLKEVPQFCDPSTKEDWSSHAHQQLIYEGVGSIGLITLYPDQIPVEDRKPFTKIGVKILPQGDFYKRQVLDEYLARALSLPLSEVTEEVYSTNEKGLLVTKTGFKTLELIDDNNYVLTLDFALKMINIHERRECGMPVIIEGETGVGKTELLKMLSKLWNYSYETQLKGYKQQLQKILISLRKKKQVQFEMQLWHFLIADEESFVAGDCNEVVELKKISLELRKSPSLSVLLPRKDKKDEFWRIVNSLEDDLETKDLFKLLEIFDTASEVSTFHKLDVHAGLKTHDIVSFFNQVNQQAQRISTSFQDYPDKAKIPRVTAYLDEINTSCCMGLFKEIIIDRTIDGVTIPDNVFIIAACNPLRGDSTVLLQNVKNVWVKPSYYVRELHPTIDYLKWDYGALNDAQEEEYINAKMFNITDEHSLLTSRELTYFVVQSQRKMRNYAQEMLKNKGVGDKKEAWRCSRSCVSQRDMQRVFDFHKWLLNTYRTFHRYTSTAEEGWVETEQQLRALLVSLGLVYYLRLGERDREHYASFLDKECQEMQFDGIVNFTTAFNDELEWYIERMNLPSGIAKTRALKENVFANIACCQTHTPLIIIGEPGTSKTLSFNLVSSSFKGRSSKIEELKNANIFRALQPFFYQCSKHTNSIELENLFKQAIGRQMVFESSRVPTYCVVFMDEAGLPEERHESLKVLHYHLDRKEVSFVAITNHALDAAKTNRAISLYRPETSAEDLTILAKDLLHTSTPMTNREQNIIDKLCFSFSEVMTNLSFQNFYGQRDFMHFISDLRRRRGNGFLTEDIVLQALERNFNGHENFSEVFDKFLEVMDSSYHQMKKRNVIEIFRESLHDLPLSVENENQEEKELVHYTEKNVRYKLIIDSSEDDSAVRYLFSCNILDREKTQMIACSDFPEESGIHISAIAEIIHSAENGDTIIMFQTDKIHESFYELFNQRFRIINDPQKDIKFFTNISIGAHTKPCRVHAKFQCVVMVKKSELENTPQAFLSRFEKFIFSYKALCSSICESKPLNLKIIITTVFRKVASFVEQLNASRSFYGYCAPDNDDKKSNDVISATEDKLTTHETLYSLILTLLPSVDKYKFGSDIQVINNDDNIDVDEKILATALNALNNYCHWIIPKISKSELRSDCKAIFKYLQRDPDFLDAMKNQFDLGGAIGEALDAIHGDVKIMGHDSCLVIAVLVQWLINYITKHLFHLMTPEALVVNANKIPKSLMKAYFEFQEHFSFKKLIQDQIKKLQLNDWKIPSKIVVYTRQSYLFGLLPLVFPYKSNQVKKEDLILLKSVIFDDVESLKMLKVSVDTPEGEICKEIASFISNENQSLFVLIANMQDSTVDMINFLRIVIEEKESKSLYNNKLFVILLYFPEVQFFYRCYPALFLNGWDHFYLDSLTTKIIPELVESVVDIKQCFRIALKISDSNDALCLYLEPLLEAAIPVISSRVIVGSSCGGAYNKIISVSARQEQLRDIFFDKGTCACTPIGKAFCTFFHEYWDKNTILRFLKDAVNFTFSHQSTLSITSYIQTRIKALFFEFVVYVLWLINQDCNLDTLFLYKSNSSYKSVQNIFSSVMKTMPKKLHSLKSLSGICHSLCPPEDKKFHFPFFSMAYHYIEDLVDVCREVVNKSKINGPTITPSAKETKELLENEMLKEMEIMLCQLIDVHGCENSQAEQGKEKDQAIATIILSLKSEKLWQSYLNDFIKLKCTQSDELLAAHPEETVFGPVLSICFNLEQQSVKDKDFVSRLALLHVHSEIHKTDLIETTAKLNRLHKFLEIEIVATNTDYKHLEIKIIERSYESLCDILDDQVGKLQQWYMLYKDIVQMESLYDSLHDLEDPQLRLYFFKIHTMYSLVHSHEDPISVESLRFCISFYNKEIKQISATKIECVFSKMLSPLNNQKNDSFRRSVVDMLLSFMFHTITLPSGHTTYIWFFKEALPGGKLLQYITPAQYQFYLLSILKIKKQVNEDQSDVLKIFRSDLRNDIKTHLNEKPKDTFIFDSKKMTLADAYMRVVYLQQAKDVEVIKPAAALAKLNSLIHKTKICKDQSELCLLKLETEAFVQIFLQVMAYNIASLESSQGVLLGRIPSQIEDFLKNDDKKGLIFCMHLWHRLKSTEKLTRTLSTYPEEKLIFLNNFKAKAKEQSQESFEFSFPVLIQKESELGELYRRTCKVMLDIHQKKKKNDELKKLKLECDSVAEVELSMLHDESIKVKKKNALCMCIWLCSFYEYYKKKIKSEHLASAVHSEMEDYFSEECIILIICFINSQLIQPQKEQDLPSDRNAAILNFVEGHGIVPIYHQQGVRTDPIFNLFFNEKDDQSKQICNALASLVAVILACPDQSNHLWYHLFSPGRLSGTQVTGFLFDSAIKEGRLYDCGIVLNEEGGYGRPEYLLRAEKGILTLHSLYLLLWCNFGAFCINLLTQRESNIKGTLITSELPIRHQCKTQLSLMWLNMRANIGLTDEQISLLIVCSMKRIIKVSYEKHKGLLLTLEERNVYEKMWHTEVFVPSLKEVNDSFDRYLLRLQADDFVLKLNLRELHSNYPHVPTLQFFTHYVQKHCITSERRGKFNVLVKLMNSHSRLQSYSALLPSLIEFYRWIVTDLSHVLTQEESMHTDISSAVELASKKYSKQVKHHYIKLFESVQKNYNKYLDAIGKSIGAGACATTLRENAVPMMIDTMPVFRFLPGETKNETVEEIDYLYLVIQDIINFHNTFLKEINELIKCHNNLKKYLHVINLEAEDPVAVMPCVHPLAVNEYSCILGRRSLLELILKHQTGTGFNLDEIQEEFVSSFIAGKLSIDDSQNKLKMQFHYKLIHSEDKKLEHPTDLMLTLDHLHDKDLEIPVLQDDTFLRALKYELFILDYEKLVDIAHGLKTISEHIIQKLNEKKICKNDVIDQNVGDVLLKIVYDQEKFQSDFLKVFDDLGMNKLQSTHRMHIAAIPIKHLLTTLKTIVEWIKDGIYDFHTLPKAMKVPLTKKDEDKILAIHKNYRENDTDELLDKLKGLAEVLTDCEQNLIKKIDEEMDISIFQYLRDLSLVTDDDEILIRLFPKHIKPKNYMALRICLRKVIICIEEGKDDDNVQKSKWSEYVHDLWSKEKLGHLREMATAVDYTQVYDPFQGAYGFEDEFESTDEESEVTVVHVCDKLHEEQQDSQKLSHHQAATEEVPPSDHDLSAAADRLEPQDIADYLRSLKLDDYIEEFMKNEIDGSIMYDIDDETIESMGVDTKKDRIKIKNKFKQWLRKKVTENT